MFFWLVTDGECMANASSDCFTQEHKEKIYTLSYFARAAKNFWKKIALCSVIKFYHLICSASKSPGRTRSPTKPLYLAIMGGGGISPTDPEWDIKKRKKEVQLCLN